MEPQGTESSFNWTLLLKILVAQHLPRRGPGASREAVLYRLTPLWVNQAVN